jgi:hypothetical protein
MDNILKAFEKCLASIVTTEQVSLPSNGPSNTVRVLTGYGDEAREHGTRARTRERHEGATHKYFSMPARIGARLCVCCRAPPLCVPFMARRSLSHAA